MVEVPEELQRGVVPVEEPGLRGDLPQPLMDHSVYIRERPAGVSNINESDLPLTCWQPLRVQLSHLQAREEVLDAGGAVGVGCGVDDLELEALDVASRLFASVVASPIEEEDGVLAPAGAFVVEGLRKTL